MFDFIKHESGEVAIREGVDVVLAHLLGTAVEVHRLMRGGVFGRDRKLDGIPEDGHASSEEEWQTCLPTVPGDVLGADDIGVEGRLRVLLAVGHAADSGKVHDGIAVAEDVQTTFRYRKYISRIG